MPIGECKICSKKFYAKPYFLRLGHAKYCSKECQYQGAKTGKMVFCSICNKEVYKRGRALNNSKSGKLFCSKSCQTKWRNSFFVGPKHANWKNGSYEYKTILRRHKIPEICGVCKTKDSRVLATHHVDKNHRNNKLENLAWLCHNCHFLVHHYDVERKQFDVSINGARSSIG